MSQPNKLKADIAEKFGSFGSVSPQEQTVEQPHVEEAELRGDVGAAPVADKKGDKKKPERRFGTYVFMNLETTASSMPGLSKELEKVDPELKKKFWKYFNRLARSRNPEDYKNHFDCWKKHLAKRWTPTFAEIAFLAVSAERFENLITLDEKGIQENVQGLSFKENALDMDVPEDDLEPEDVLQKNVNSPYQFYYCVKRKVEEKRREKKVSFQDAWNGKNGLRKWLDKLQKPVCLGKNNCSTRAPAMSAENAPSGFTATKEKF